MNSLCKQTVGKGQLNQANSDEAFALREKTAS